MAHKELCWVIDNVTRDAVIEAEALKYAKEKGLVLPQRLINAGLTYQRLAMELFVAVKDADEYRHDGE